MTDRVIVYAGQVPLETDELNTNRNVLKAIGWLTQGVMGTNTLVTDSTCVPTGPASLSVNITQGQIFSLQNVDNSSYSSLTADTSHQIVKQGILADVKNLAITPPGTVGFSQNYLIQAQFAETDGGSTTLPYYNPSAPAVAWSGPAGYGTPQFTVRQGLMTVTAKAGTAATTGTQTTPAPDAGFVGLFVVVVANGQATISSGNITKLATAPMLGPNGQLPLIPIGVQGQTWTYWPDTGAVNAMVIAPVPAIVAYAVGQRFVVKVGTTNTSAVTLNVNGLGAKSVIYNDGSAILVGDFFAGSLLDLEYDGTNFQCLTRTVSSLSRIRSNGPVQQAYTTAGVSTFVVPAGITYVDVEVWGAGGGGGSNNQTTFGGGGAAGAAYARKLIAVTPGQNITVTVGAKGIAGVGGGAGGNGGTTSFGAFCSAPGSQGALGNGNTSSTGPIGVGGDINFCGNGGSQGKTVNSAALGGAGGSAPMSGGASSESFGVGYSAQAGAYGAGGSGGGGSIGTTAGAGADGAVLIRY